MSSKYQRAKRARRGDRSFQPGSAGKGDGDRTADVDAYRANYDEIDWQRAAPLSKTTLETIRRDAVRQIWQFDWSSDF